MPRVGITEAAKTLGISKDAVRKRIARGTLQADKDETGRWMVDLPEDEDTGQTSEVVQILREEVAFLRRELERKDTILLSMTQRLPELPDRADPDRDQDVTDQARQRMEARRQEASTQEKPRSWWRRFWYGD